MGLTTADGLDVPRLLVARGRHLRLACRARRRESTDRPLIRRLTVMLQNGCALRCRMCDLWLERPARLPAEAVLALARARCLAPDAGLHLTGGEPLLYPGFASLFARLRAAAPREMSLSTSGAPADAVRAFLSARPDLRRVTLIFSFDGVGVHDLQRGTPGAERELTTLLGELPRLAPDAAVQLRMTLTPFNFAAAAATFRFARGLGLPLRYQLVDRLPQYTNSVRDAVPMLSAEQRSALRRQLVEVFNALSLRSDRHELGHLLTLLGELGADARTPIGLCPVPGQSAFVRCDGALLTCRGAEPVGDVLREGLDAAWSGAPARRLRVEGCGSCERPYNAF
jgi:MoaA/NifB/PqqE/SkfB family radical SAM enzyme